MATFKFRSSGETTEEVKVVKDATKPSVTIFGIKTPLRYGIDNLFEVTTDLAEQVGDNLKNLIQTNHGERLMITDYGANLRPLVTEWVSQDSFDAEAIKRIRSAIEKFMPYVSPKEFTSRVDRTRNTGKVAAIAILVTYDVPQLGLINKSIEVTLFVP